MHQLQAAKAKPSQQAAARRDGQPLAAPASTHERWMELQRGIGNQAVSRVLQRRAKTRSEIASKREATTQAAGSNPVLQRKCACGGNTVNPQGECEQCSKRNMERQAKLRINQPGDVYEQEADRVAEQAMQSPTHVSIGSASPGIQRMTGHPAGHSEMAPASVEQTLASPGMPLETTLQQEMGQRFGHDFSQVRMHLGAAAEQSAREVDADAYTVGKDIVFGAGQFAPGSYEGRRLLAHELTHVVQQGGGAPTVQRQPKSRPDPAREAALEQARQQGVLCSNAEDEAQWDAENKLRLVEGKSRDRNYAISLGWKDKALIQKKHAVSSKLLSEIATKTRFFNDAAKAAYLQLVGNAVIDVAGSEAGREILEPCAPERPSQAEEVRQSGPATPSWAPSKIDCDIKKNEYEFEEEDVPASSRCINIYTDPERTQNFFDDNIANAVGYSVPETTWDNVAYDRFKVMLVTYKNGKSEYFVLDDIGVFHSGLGLTKLSMWPSKYVKRKTTQLVYPLDRGRLYFLSEYVTPNIIKWKNGFIWQVKELQDLYKLLQIGGTFASIMSLYAVGVESFKTSISAFQRTGPARLPGRPLPGIGVKKGSGSTSGTPGGEAVRAPGQGVFKESGEAEEGAFKGAPKGKGDPEATRSGGPDPGGKATTAIEEGQTGGERTLTSGGGKSQYKTIGNNPDIGVLEIRDDGSVSIVSANRGDELAPGKKVMTHINLATHPNGLGPATQGVVRYRFYMANGKVTTLEPLGGRTETTERARQIESALRENNLLSDQGTIIKLDPVNGKSPPTKVAKP